MNPAPEKSVGMLFAYPLLFDVQIMLSNVVQVCFGISFMHERDGRGIFFISEINVQNLTTSNHIGDIKVSCSLSKIRQTYGSVPFAWRSAPWVDGITLCSTPRRDI
jgi:hypothetical protein